MSKNITSDNGVEIAVGVLGLEIRDPEAGVAMYARLSPWQRRSLADALDQDAAVVIGGRLTAPESQFKRERDDLRRQVDDLKERRRKHAAEREAWTRNRRELERERDAAVARAEKAEQLIPRYGMLDVWMALGRDSIHFDDWYDEHGYADAWAELTAAVREARTAPAVSYPLHKPDGTHMDASHLPIGSGDDPAVYVVRESNVEAQVALRNRFGEFVVYGTVLNVTTAEDCREKAQRHLDAAARCESIARAIEAEQAVDPVEELAGQIEAATREAIRQACYTLELVAPSLDPLAVERAMEVTAASRKVAAHVLGQEEAWDGAARLAAIICAEAAARDEEDNQ